MFFSHQLLARKAPLGQIWMAATMKSNINRRKLGKLNIIQICEEILNPSVPMALRLSGILMGGIVIVYERKVKLLYDDVSRLLVEINDAWKTKVVQDPAVLPKNKSRNKHEAVTVSKIQGMEIPEVEQSLNFSNAASMEFQHTAYVSMRLDDVEEPFYENNAREENFHQADPAEITTHDFYDPSTENANFESHFERFDIDGYDDTQVKFTSLEQTELPTLIPSPPAQQEPLNADEIPNRYPEQQVFQRSDECPRDSLSNEGQKKQEPPRKRARKPAAYVMDYEQTTIPGHTFQSWLQDTSSIVKKRGRKRKHPDIKISNLMDLPPVALMCGLVGNGGREIHYPAPLLELWLKSTQSPLDSPSGRNSQSQHKPPEPSSSSPRNGLNNVDPMGYPFEDFHSGIDSISIEKLRRHVDENLILEHATELRRTASNPGTRITETNVLATPGSSGDEIRSMASAGTGSHPSHTLRNLNRRRPYSSSGKVNIGLDPVYEDHLFHRFETNFKLSELPGSGQALENELLMETGPTQTQYPVPVPVKDHSKEQITDSIRMGFKTYFETPGAPQTESLDRLTSGVNRKQAALLFYQTCVLTTLDFIKVEQKVPYGDIIISRGAKM